MGSQLTTVHLATENDCLYLQLITRAETKQQKIYAPKESMTSGTFMYLLMKAIQALSESYRGKLST